MLDLSVQALGPPEEPDLVANLQHLRVRASTSSRRTVGAQVPMRDGNPLPTARIVVLDRLAARAKRLSGTRWRWMMLLAHAHGEFARFSPLLYTRIIEHTTQLDGRHPPRA